MCARSDTERPAFPAEVDVLLYGIGAQKAATTWLAAMLERQPDCHIAPGKELHYWTNVDRSRPRDKVTAAKQRLVRRAAADMVRSALRLRPQPALDAARLFRLFRSELRLARDPRPAAYVARLLRGWRGQRVVGEFTPNYATLSTATFARMAALHPGTRFVFVMRDPVDRLWSGIRHRFRTDSRPADRIGRDLVAAFSAAARDPKNADHRRSDYRATIEALERAVPPEHIVYLFHETLHRPGELARLAKILGLARIAVDFKQRLNVGIQSDAVPPPDAVAEARHRLDPTYGYIVDRFGERVPAAWRRAAVREEAER